MRASVGELLCKEAGLGELWERFKDVFRGEKSKADRRVETLFKPDTHNDLRWNNLPRNAGSQAFVDAVKSHPMADPKLKTHVQSMHDLTKGKTLGKVESSGGGGKTYEIKQLPSGRKGCTCSDWRYKGSIDPSYKCKHIRKFESGQMKLGAQTTAAFFDELDKIRAKKDLEKEKFRRKTNDGAFNNDLLQDETPEEIMFISPRPDEPELIVG